MKCEICGVHEATVHVRQIMGNKAVDLHLCSECAAKTGISDSELVDDLTVSQLLTGLMETHHRDLKEGDTGMCPVCGLSIEDFRKSGRTGCPECY